MRKVQNLGAALAIAGFVAVGMMTSSARLEAAGPVNGNPAVNRACELLAAAIAQLDPTSELAIYLQGQYDAYCK
jgi:hypothetical protein